MKLDVAIDPEVVLVGPEFRILASHIGFYHGRVVSRFPKDWAAQAFQAADVLPEPERRRVVEAIRRIKDSALIPSGRPYDGERSWCDNAETAHRTKPFAEIFARESRAGFVAIEEISGDDLSSSAARREVGNVENLMDSLSPLLASSGTLVLVDPYFSPARGPNRELFNRVLSVAFSERCIEFRAYVREKHWMFPTSRCESGLKALIDSRWDGKKRISVFVLDDDGGDDALHARYLFSERGGLRLDKGLQVDRSKVDISVINKATHDDLMRTFIERPFAAHVAYECSFVV